MSVISLCVILYISNKLHHISTSNILFNNACRCFALFGCGSFMTCWFCSSVIHWCVVPTFSFNELFDLTLPPFSFSFVFVFYILSRHPASLISFSPHIRNNKTQGPFRIATCRRSTARGEAADRRWAAGYGCQVTRGARSGRPRAAVKRTVQLIWPCFVQVSQKSVLCNIKANILKQTPSSDSVH